MKKLLGLLFFLPFLTFAQSDTLYLKGGSKLAVKIEKIENGKVYYSEGTKTSNIYESKVEKYHWPNKPVVPTKKDDQIIIETSDKLDEVFVKLGRLMAEAGFPVAMANKEMGIINTGPKSVTSSSSISVNALIKTGKKTQIILTGNFDGANYYMYYGIADEQKKPLYYNPTATTGLAKAWAEMDKLAKSYPDGKISYAKKPE